jgi:hypothetical protein
MSADLYSSDYLNKQVLKLLHRVERHMVPSNQIVVSSIGTRISTLSKQVKESAFIRELPMFTNLQPLNGSSAQAAGKRKLQSDGSADDEAAAANSQPKPKSIDWDALEAAIISAISEGERDEKGCVPGFVVRARVREEIDAEKHAQIMEEMKLRGKTKLRTFQVIALTL